MAGNDGGQEVEVYRSPFSRGLPNRDSMLTLKLCLAIRSRGCMMKVQVEMIVYLGTNEVI